MAAPNPNHISYKLEEVRNEGRRLIMVGIYRIVIFLSVFGAALWKENYILLLLLILMFWDGNLSRGSRGE